MWDGGLCPVFSRLQRHRLYSYLRGPLIPAAPLQFRSCPTAASPPGTVSSTREPLEVPPPSFKPRSPPWSLFSICHICHVASILHATLNKQTICPIAPSPRALFFTSVLSAICHLRLNLSHPFSHLIIPSRLPPCLRPRYTKQHPPPQSTSPPSAFELSYLEGFLLSPLPLLTAWRSHRRICNWSQSVLCREY